MEPVLAIDVGSGTQDILIYHPEKEMENNIKMILPSQTRIIGAKIKEAYKEGKDVYLYGRVMGGGANKRAVEEHISGGLNVFSTEEAAFTFKDDLEKVKNLGVKIKKDMPDNKENVVSLELKDVDIESLSKALSHFGVEVPGKYAVALQDHGFSPDVSNRKFRFKHWENFLQKGGNIKDLVYKREIPQYFNRMLATREQLEDVVMMDTGAAAILGALEDEKVKEVYESEGCLFVNVGNQHTIAFLLRQGKVYGVFEHHTGLLTSKSLKNYLEKFKRCELTDEEVFEEMGHGCQVLEEAGEFPWDFTVVTGPRREMGQNIGYLAVPHGDMMLSGCFGLIKGLELVEGKTYE